MHYLITITLYIELIDKLYYNYLESRGCMKKKKKLQTEIEIIDDEVPKKEKSSIKTILLIISIFLLIISLGLCGYLYYQNNVLEKEVKDSKDNITKVQEKIDSGKKEINEKENEYEKLKEDVKENLEELSIWEETKEKLNQSLS